MSNLLVQNIKHTNNTTSMAIDTSGQVTICGEGSATTTNLQQGLAKTWVNFDGTATDAASRDSFNVSGMTDNGTGDYRISHSNDFANANYSTVGASAFNAWCGPDVPSGTLTGSVDVYTQTGTHTRADRDILNFASLGDLA